MNNGMQFSQKDVQDALNHIVPLFGNASGLAKEIGISRGHMSRLLSGDVRPGKKVLDYLDLKICVVYVPNN